MTVLSHLVTKLPAVRVLIVGDLMQDVDWYCTAERFAPESPGAPIYRRSEVVVRPGAAGAVAAMVDALAGVSTLRFGAAMSQRQRCWLADRMVFRLDDDLISDGIPDANLPDAVKWSDVLVICDYGKGACTEEVVSLLLAASRQAGIPSLVHPARGVKWEAYWPCSCFVAHHTERPLAAAYPDWSLAGHRQVLTQGARGLVLDEGNEVLPVPARPRRVVDPTGCGDMVLATLAVCVGGGMSWRDAAVVACAAGGLEVERRGAVGVPRAHLVADLEHAETGGAG